MKIEFEEYSTIEDIFLYLIATEYTPEVKHLLPVSLYKDYVFSIVPLSPLSEEVLTMVYAKGKIDTGIIEFDISTKKYRSVLAIRFTASNRYKIVEKNMNWYRVLGMQGTSYQYCRTMDISYWCYRTILIPCSYMPAVLFAAPKAGTCSIYPQIHLFSLLG